MAAFGLTALNTVLYFLSDGLQQSTHDSKEPVTQRSMFTQLYYVAVAADCTILVKIILIANAVWINNRNLYFACQVVGQDVTNHRSLRTQQQR